MIDPMIRDFAYAALVLLKKRNDRNGPPITAYIKALEDELERYKTRLATPIVAHLEDFEQLNAEAAAKRPTELLKAVGSQDDSSMGVIEVIAAAEAKAAAEAAAKPWWKFWAASSGGESPEAPKGGCCGGECACAKKALAALPAAKEETK